MSLPWKPQLSFPLNTLNMPKQRLKGRFARHPGFTRQVNGDRSDRWAAMRRFFACLAWLAELGFPLNTLNMPKQRLKGRFARHPGFTRQVNGDRSDRWAPRRRFFACLAWLAELGFPLNTLNMPKQRLKGRLKRHPGFTRQVNGDERSDH
jgi:hypothetical protein